MSSEDIAEKSVCRQKIWHRLITSIISTQLIIPAFYKWFSTAE